MNKSVRLSDGFEFRAGGIFTCDRNWNSPFGAEGLYLKVYAPFEGEAQLQVSEREWVTLERGKLYVIPAYLPHAYRCDQTMSLAWLHMKPTTPSLVAPLQSLSGTIIFGEEELEGGMGSMVQACRILGDIPGSPRLEDLAEAKSECLMLHAFLLSLSAKLIPHAKEEGGGLAHEAAMLIEGQLNQTLDLRVIAKRLKLSSGHLRRVFRERLGETPLQYHERHRVMMAQIALLDKRLSVSEVASRCGWKDPLYFSKVFKARTGISPRDYKKRSEQP